MINNERRRWRWNYWKWFNYEESEENKNESDKNVLVIKVNLNDKKIIKILQNKKSRLRDKKIMIKYRRKKW